MLIVKSCVGLKTGKQLEQLKPLKVIHNIYKKRASEHLKDQFWRVWGTDAYQTRANVSDLPAKQTELTTDSLKSCHVNQLVM